MRSTVVALTLFYLPILVMAQTPNAVPCSASEYRRFDFWLGEWDVFNPAGTKVGDSRIEKIIGDCVLLESYSGKKGYEGKSFNVYNASTRQWQQFWVDNAGAVLELSGTLRGNALAYSGSTRDSAGAVTRHRLTFFPVVRDSVRQLWEQSTDDGTNWTVAFDGRYVRKAKGSKK